MIQKEKESLEKMKSELQEQQVIHEAKTRAFELDHT